MLSYDSFNQLSQISSGQYNNWHPFLHTYIEKICLIIWHNPASVCLLQITIFSLIWMAICKYNRKSKTKREFFLQIFLTFLIVINPINSIYSITLWKDVLFSYLFLLFSFLIEILIDKRFEISNKSIIFLVVIGAVISKLRHNGFIAIFLFLIFLCIIFWKKKNKKAFKLVIISYIFSLLLFYGIEVIYNVTQVKSTFLNVKVMHAIAYYDSVNLLESDDLNIVSNVIEIKDMQDSYNKYYSDDLSYKINMQNFEKYKSDLFKIFFNQSINHPIAFAKYVLNSSNMIWDIVRPNNAVGNILLLNLDAPNNEFNISHINREKEIYQKAHDFILNSLNNKFTQTVLYSGALYFYLSIIVIFLIIKNNKNFKYIIVLVPNIINIIIVAASTPIQDIRYIYPNFLLFYLLLIILFRLFYEKNEKN